MGIAFADKSATARFFPAVLIGALIFVACPSASAAVASIEMLAPNVGLATTADRDGGKNRLFWTSDGGAHWQDITPNPFPNSEHRSLSEFSQGYVPSERIAAVFFLDTREGWVLFCCGQPDSADAEDDGLPRYDLARTTDSGATWSIARVGIPAEIKDSVKYAEGGRLYFADSLHGWINLTTCQFTHTCGASMIATSDGGRTWRPLEENPPGSADPFSIVSPSVGWQVSIPNEWVGTDENAGLYVTHDGAKNWKQVSLPFPRKMLSRAFVKGSRPSASYHDFAEVHR